MSAMQVSMQIPVSAVGGRVSYGLRIEESLLLQVKNVTSDLEPLPLVGFRQEALSNLVRNRNEGAVLGEYSRCDP